MQGTSCARAKGDLPANIWGGPGILSMIVLLLERCFGVQFSDIDHRNMDVKPDTHIVRVFSRLGFFSRPDEAEALKAARRLFPEDPGALDPPTWIIVKKWCAFDDPQCQKCPLNEVCSKKNNSHVREYYIGRKIMIIIITSYSACKDDSVPIPDGFKVVKPKDYLDNKDLIAQLQSIRERVFQDPKAAIGTARAKPLTNIVTCGNPLCLFQDQNRFRTNSEDDIGPVVN